MTSTHWRWGRALLCLLFVFGIFFHLGHSAPAMAHEGMMQLVSGDSGIDPCDQMDAWGADHCKSANPCPLCGPVDFDAMAFDDAGSRPQPIIDALVLGLAIDPQLRPPRLFLQA